MLSDGMVHFLKIEKNVLKQIYQNYLVALNIQNLEEKKSLGEVLNFYTCMYVTHGHAVVALKVTIKVSNISKYLLKQINSKSDMLDFDWLKTHADLMSNIFHETESPVFMYKVQYLTNK